MGFTADQKEVNIFDLVKFDLRTEKEFTLLDLSQEFDSIKWTVNDVDGSLCITGDPENENRSVFGWGHVFFVPGIYEAFMTGYKDKEIIPLDSASITVVNKKDYLKFNWKEIESTKSGEAFTDVLNNDYMFSLDVSSDNGTPGVTLYCTKANSSSDGEFKDLSIRSGKILQDYITKIYSEPAYDTSNKQLLQDKYRELFRLADKGFTPKCIWTTSSSNIVLIKRNKESFFIDYYIYAEQKK